MAYGTIKVDNITYTNAGSDTTVTVSGLATGSGFTNLTATGTISGATITGNVGQFTTLTAGVATITSGVFASGTASAPSVSFIGDANTGLYSPGADQVAISTNGTERMRLDSSGRLGLGTSSPGYLLDVAGTVNVVNGSNGRINIGATNNYLYGDSVGNVIIGTSGSDKFQITSAGRVGIGTQTPGGKLAVSDGTAYFQFDPVGGTANILRSLTGAGSREALQLDATQLVFANSGSERFRCDTSGRFLVGTSTSPSAGNGQYSLFVVQGQPGTAAAGANISIQRGEAAAGGNITSGEGLGNINWCDNAGNTFAVISGEADANAGTNDYPGRLVFSTTADGASSPTERMRIESTGNVSIGSGATTTYRVGVSVASGADRDVFLAGISGASNGLQINWVHASTALSVKFNNITTTASAANAFLDSADGNRIYRSTSSLRYKTNVEDIDHLRSDAILGLRPVWYRSKAADDRSDWSWYGLIAEEVAAVEPRLVHWTYLDEDYEIEEIDGAIKKTPKPDAELVPDGVQYDRLTVLLLDVVKRQNERIEALEAKVAALEAS